MSTTRPRPTPTAPAHDRGPRDDRLEGALEALRREWRDGCRAGMALRLAAANVRRLHDRAESRQAIEAVEAVERGLAAYRSLPPDRRKDELTRLAGALNALRPHLRDAPAVPFGKLPGAIAPVGRGARPATAKSKAPAAPAALRLPLAAPVTDLPRVGPAVAKKLANLHVATVEDLLTLAPRRHIDYSRTEKIGAALGFIPGREVTVRGEVIDLREVRGPGPPRVVAKIADGTGSVRVTWFNKFVAHQLALGDEIAVSGKLDAGYGAPSFTSPEWEKVGGDGGQALSTGRLIPVYPLTQGLAQKTLRGLTRAALDATHDAVVDFLPDPVRLASGEVKLPTLRRAYEQVHYPGAEAELELAQRRLAFDDLFLLQLGLVRRKRERRAEGGIPFAVDDALLRRFRRALPFRLTGAQDRALTEILADLGDARPMARLLQGDVGSGKTVVAAAAVLVARANGCQSAVMAPTEILAEQHFHNFRGLYAGLAEGDRPSVALLT
ncbi:MAG: OB-fold nucleic acid binding domain-containing protein, partial [Chloroflexota bacterium]|nr:OB-fold nucleic acid binding domain-containing protein [Chloroflexota bacterium]